MTLLHSSRSLLVLACMGGASAIVAAAACGGDDPAAPSDVPDGAAGIDGAVADAPVSDGGSDALAPPVIDPLSVDDQSRSGTRIRVVRHRTNDGIRYLAGLRDADLGIDCRLARATDGKIRCLPPVLPPLTVHLDAACTGPTFVVQPASCGEGLVGVEKNTCIDKVVAAHELGAPVAATVVYENYLGECRERPVGAGRVVRPIGAEKAASAFAEATLEPFPSDAGAGDASAGPRTAAMLGKTADGAVAFLGPWDLPTDARCIFTQVSQSGELRCFPPAVDVITSFADPGCTERLAIASQCSTGAKIARETRFVDGGVELDLYAAGAAYTGATYALDGNDTCNASAGTTMAVRVGAPIAPEPFQIIRSYASSGPGRLRVTGHDATTFRWPTGFHDSKTDRACIRVETEAGMHCVSNLDGIALDAFGDDACTQPIRVALIGGPPTATTLTPYLAPTCGLAAKRQLFTIGAARTTPYWEKQKNGVCVKASATVSYELGTEADAATLSAFEAFFPEP